jgi:hypothetical protein
MSAYTIALPVVDIGGGDYLTDADLRWDLGKEGSGLTYTVPAGFRFDVSVPRILQWAFSPKDRRFLKAAALHDHMLENGWSRIESAAVFHEALKADKVSRLKRLAMFLAVALWRYR